MDEGFKVSLPQPCPFPRHKWAFGNPGPFFWLPWRLAQRPPNRPCKSFGPSFSVHPLHRPSSKENDDAPGTPGSPVLHVAGTETRAPTASCFNFSLSLQMCRPLCLVPSRIRLVPRRHELPQAEVGGMAEGNGTTHESRKDQPERAGQTSAAVVARLPTEALELNGAPTLGNRKDLILVP